MERLTKPAVNKTGNKYVSAIGSSCGAWPRIIQRLAAYENTGLEPEEIEDIKKAEPLFIPPLKLSDEELRRFCAAGPIIVPHSEPSIEFIEHRWIPVTERLPDKELWEYQKKYDQDNMEVLVMIKGAKAATTLYYDADGDFSDDNGDTWLVTHWQPMPEPPKEDE